MDTKEYQKMFELEQTHFWFREKLRVILYFLDRLIDNRNINLLDVGCGTGILLAHLKNYGRAIGVDISDVALGFCQKRNLTKIIKADASYLPFSNEVFDGVFCLESLLSVKDDLRAIREFYRVTKKEGFLIIHDVAYKSLRIGSIDAGDGIRRYTRQDLTKKIEEVGFVIRKSSYRVIFLFPIIFILRNANRLFKIRRSDLIRLPIFLNEILGFILKAEGSLLKKINFPFGVSILCIAKKC